ncbi:MAG TPA: sugar ABC transporter permease [Pyrinomonadaceae bacterium]|nr:sugar ABC transporter permease [Pyrinomonadaceae bacterium]
MKIPNKESLCGLLFISPTLLGFLVFFLGPIFAVLFLSFTRYDMFSAPESAGLANYAKLLTDSQLHKVYGNTFFFGTAAIILNVSLGLFLAILVNQRLPAFLRYLLRTVYFFPVLVGMIYAATVWKFLFNRDLGVINYYLHYIGVGPVSWLTSSQFALWSIILVYMWKNVGFTMLTTLAGLQGIPQDIYEAAAIDGARPFAMLRKITIPLLSPVILFNVVITLINTMQEFDSIVALTNGGPGNASRTVSLYIYEKAFRGLDMGYASAIAVTLFLVIALLTALQFSLSRRWVHYS